MAELKTKVGSEDMNDFLNKVTPDQKRKDCFQLLEMLINITGIQPKIWGNAIVGFGTFQYKQKSGQAGDWFMAGFSPRKQNISIYTMSGFNQHEPLMCKLGKFKTGVGCLYINRLSDIDVKVLNELMRLSFDEMKNKYTVK